MVQLWAVEGCQGWPWVEPRGFPSGAALVACAVEVSGLTVDVTTSFPSGAQALHAVVQLVQ